jgi:hypothetical protein
MAVNDYRSMNADLVLGSQVDGRVKTLDPDRGGDVDYDSVMERAQHLQPQYNMAHNYHTYAENCTCSYCV